MTIKAQGIYMIKNIENNMIYVGRSTNLDKRKKSHIDSLNKKEHGNYKLQADWNKYGERKFQFWNLLELEDMTISRQVEKDYITHFIKKGLEVYNLSDPMSEWNSVIDGRTLKRQWGNKEEFLQVNNLLIQNRSDSWLTSDELYVYSFISMNRNVRDSVFTTVKIIDEYLPIKLSKKKSESVKKIKEILNSLNDKGAVTITNHGSWIENFEVNDPLCILLGEEHTTTENKKGHVQIPCSMFYKIENIHDYHIYVLVSRWRKEPFKAAIYDWTALLNCSTVTAKKRIQAALNKKLIYVNIPEEKYKYPEYSILPFVYDNLDDL